MATTAIAELGEIKKKSMETQFGSAGNQFVNELKSSTLFQFNWGELLSAAPTALSLMGSCWVAASSPIADQISMTKSVPIGGFKYIVNQNSPTLRSILVIVCNNGGRDAFTIAGKNMAGLQIRSHDITQKRIPRIFELLKSCTKSKDGLEDFTDAVKDFGEDAKQAAKLATETREAFTLWGKMVGELHAATEHQQGTTSIERGATSIAEKMAAIDQKFAEKAAETATNGVLYAKKQVEKAEKRLDAALDKVPGPWQTVIQGAVTGFTQAVPSIIAGALPMVLAASNPLAGLAMAAGGAGAAGAAGKQASSTTTNGERAIAAADQTVAVAQKASDPAYVVAEELRDLVTHFYEFLGGDSKPIDWSKFEESKEDAASAEATQSGTAYLAATLKGRKGELDVTGTEPNKKVLATLERLIKVVDEIAAAQEGKSDMSAEPIPEKTITNWKSSVKKAKTDILQLIASNPSQGTQNTPVGFGNVKIEVPKTDLSAQTAQLSSAMQGVQISQNSVDLAESSYEAAAKKQAETAKAMAEVEKRLKSLKEQGQTLDDIKKVLRDCIAVLVDLVAQIAKLEQFFIMLTTVIDHVVLPEVDRFSRDITKLGERAARDKIFSVNNMAKQTIYTSTLSLKAYFSLLEDIAQMYTQVHKDYIRGGLELCGQLSAGSASRISIDQLSQNLTKYTQDSSKKVAEIVDARQQEILKGLRERVKKAAETSAAIEDTVREAGIDTSSTKAALEQGKDQAVEHNEALLASSKSATEASNDENYDLS